MWVFQGWVKSLARKYLPRVSGTPFLPLQHYLLLKHIFLTVVQAEDILGVDEEDVPLESTKLEAVSRMAEVSGQEVSPQSKWYTFPPVTTLLKHIFLTVVQAEDILGVDEEDVPLESTKLEAVSRMAEVSGQEVSPQSKWYTFPPVTTLLATQTYFPYSCTGGGYLGVDEEHVPLESTKVTDEESGQEASPQSMW